MAFETLHAKERDRETTTKRVAASARVDSRRRNMKKIRSVDHCGSSIDRSDRQRLIFERRYLIRNRSPQQRHPEKKKDAWRIV